MSAASPPRRSSRTAARYAYDGTDVTHTVEMSLYPNWVGTRQVRHVRLSDDGDTSSSRRTRSRWPAVVRSSD